MRTPRAALVWSVLALLCLWSGCATAEKSDAWKSRTIYQLLTDRFGNPVSQSPCADLSKYCGGTFSGIVSQLDYITDMGFDAIWISPIPKNTPEGYHGYWAEDLSVVNPHFGGETGLQALMSAAQQADLWVMLDVVGNHMGPVCSGPSSLS
jgi:alpha-amylase